MTQGLSPDLTPVQRQVLAAIQRAADSGLACPTNMQFFETVGCGISQASEIITSLERRGIIRVERGNSRRVVTIIATGKRTAGEIAEKHWRDRPEHRAKIQTPRPLRSPVKPDALAGLTVVERDPCFYCGARPDACVCGGGRA